MRGSSSARSSVGPSLFVTSTRLRARRIVLVHGGAVDHRIWDLVIPRLAGIFTCLRYDRRGLGRSRRPPPGHRRSETADLLALLRRGGSGRGTPTTLVASSVGAGAAVRAALAEPDLVRAMVLLSPSLPGRPVSAGTRRRLAELGTAATAGRRALVTAFLADPHLTAGPLDDTRRALVSRVVGENRSAWTGGGAAEPASPLIDRLDRLHCPVRVLVGERDTADNRELADLIARRVPAAELVDVPAAGHLLEIDRPELVAREIRELADRAGR